MEAIVRDRVVEAGLNSLFADPRILSIPPSTIEECGNTYAASLGDVVHIDDAVVLVGRHHDDFIADGKLVEIVYDGDVISHDAFLSASSKQQRATFALVVKL